MPSNDTPPRPFVPKTEAEREQIVQMCKRAAASAFSMGRHTNKCVTAGDFEMLAEETVPRVPRVWRRVTLPSGGWVEYHEERWHICDPNGMPFSSCPTAVNVAAAHWQTDKRDTIHAELMALKANPDEPAPPAAAQGGAKLTWEQLSDFAVSIQRVTKAGGWNSDVTPAEVATLNAKLASLLGAVPVGRAYPVYGYAVVHRDETISTHAAGPTRDTSATLAAAKRAALPGNVIHTLYDGGPIDALRGLAPTVTP